MFINFSQVFIYLQDRNQFIYRKIFLIQQLLQLFIQSPFLFFTQCIPLSSRLRNIGRSLLIPCQCANGSAQNCSNCLYCIRMIYYPSFSFFSLNISNNSNFAGKNPLHPLKVQAL